jgi:metal-responsive CopG/Arc/MetJ family transcriptional regulator
MRVKTSVTIDERVLRAIDRAAGPGRSRSRIIEDAARDYLTRQARATRDARDRKLIDEVADDLNAEMEDVLSYQADL